LESQERVFLGGVSKSAVTSVPLLRISVQQSHIFRGHNFKVGQHVTVKLTGGRLVEVEIKAAIESTEGRRLQVSLGGEAARIYLWQVVERLRSNIIVI
jgi:hypothetical protein